MRRTYNAKILEEDGKFVGINLGADFCAEHEFGIAPLERMLGLDKNQLGIDGHRISWDSAQNHVFTGSWRYGKEGWYGLMICTNAPTRKLKEYLPQPYAFSKDEMCMAWDDRSLGIVVHKDKKELIDRLLEAMKSDDLAIGLGRSMPFSNGGLKLIVISALSDEAKQAQLKAEEERERLLAAARKTKIESFLEKHGKKYHALAPSWFSPDFHPDGRILKTKHPVIFFLNPYEQSKYKCGWFTVEELKDWGRDKGIIIKNN